MQSTLPPSPSTSSMKDAARDDAILTRVGIWSLVIASCLGGMCLCVQRQFRSDSTLSLRAERPASPGSISHSRSPSLVPGGRSTSKHQRLASHEVDVEVELEEEEQQQDMQQDMQDEEAVHQVQ